MPYVCLQNYVNALVKIQPLMPLTEQPESKEKTLRFSQVVQSLTQIREEFVSFDMILDAVLYESICGEVTQL